jgi:hypothetical protein
LLKLDSRQAKGGKSRERSKREEEQWDRPKADTCVTGRVNETGGNMLTKTVKEAVGCGGSIFPSSMVAKIESEVRP